MNNNLQIEYVPIGKLQPYERNPREHSPEQIDAIAASITEFGWSSPIVVDGDYGIVAGHGRHMAAQALGMQSVPVVQLKHLTEQQRRALVIAENQLALRSGWNAGLLNMELSDLKLGGFDLAMLGFSDKELKNLFGDALSNARQLEGLNYAIIVRCKDEKDQKRTLAKLNKLGLKCEALIS